MNKNGTYFAVAVNLIGSLSPLTLEKEGVLKAVLVGSPTTSNGVKYNEYLQHTLLFTNIGDNYCIASLKTISPKCGTMESNVSAPIAIKSFDELLSTLLSIKNIPTSVTNSDGMMTKAVLRFFLENGQLTLGVYVYDNEQMPSLSAELPVDPSPMPQPEIQYSPPWVDYTPPARGDMNKLKQQKNKKRGCGCGKK